MTKAWLDLYWHGQNLAYICKAFRTKFNHAEENDDDHMMLVWAEALRKATVNCVDVAKTVLGVEQLVKNKPLTFNQ